MHRAPGYRIRQAILLILCGAAALHAQTYDVVIQNGRAMDPETGLDAVRQIGIQGGRIAAISEQPLTGRVTIDARGLVVSPGFIDPHAHGQAAENYRLQAMDGVTTTLELEVGASPIDPWYDERAGKALINYGVSAGHLKARMAVMGDKGTFVPQDEAIKREPTDAEREQILTRLRTDLQHGALGIGTGVAYVPKASRDEIYQLFRLAARYQRPCYVHMRYAGVAEPGAMAALQELLWDAQDTGAPLHVVHITSTALKDTQACLQQITRARGHGMHVTTEAYPYTAGMTSLESAIFNEGWQESFGIGFDGLQWVATGERLTADTFARYRNQGGLVAVHSIPEASIEQALKSPVVMIGSDSLLNEGKGHPRSSGTHSRVLGRYVRERKTLPLMEALRKMTLMPAELIETATHQKRKGRLQVGMDADITVFDPERIADRATFEQPAVPSVGVQYVLVSGTLVVKDGVLQQGVAPGKPVRAYHPDMYPER